MDSKGGSFIGKSMEDTQLKNFHCKIQKPWLLNEVWVEVEDIINKEITEQVSKLKYSGCKRSILKVQEGKNNLKSYSMCVEQ